MKVVVVGCTHAGTAAVKTILNDNPGTEVVVYERNDNISFLSCGIALYVGGVVKDPQGLFYSNPDELASLGATVRMEHDVTSIDTVGKTLTVRLIDFSRENLSKIVASRKVILEETKAKKEAEAWETLHEGDVVKAEIKRFTKFGAFAEINGIDGLIHLSQISWKHINSCDEVLKIGEIVDVKILSLNKDEKKLSLSIKALTPEPWSIIDQKYAVNSAVLGKVVRINDFGAFVELEPGIDGLVHISKISHDHIKHPSEVLRIGEEVKCIILSIDKENKRIALSIKDAQ